MAPIRSVAVIGAGVMGAAIAAQVANAGIDVMLLDIVKPGEPNRDALAQAAIAQLKKANPAPLMGARAARLIKPGNIEDNLEDLRGCDWIVEAVVERLDIKQALYRRLDGIRRPGAIVSSNTSTIPLHELTPGLPESFTRNFCITHFFNPPRYMRLLELVAPAGIDAAALNRLADFIDVGLGKTVIRANDTPGFIANRIGTYWIQAAMLLAVEMGLEVEEADLVMGRPMGFPSTGVFGLLDLVGIDLAPHVNASLARLLPADDAFHAVNRDPVMVKELIAQGYTGKKGKGGFYREARGAAGKREKSALSLAAAKEGRLEWRAAIKPDIAEVKDARKDLKKLLTAKTPAGRYAWGVLGRVLAYAASLVPEVAEDIADVDAAMRLGYTWKFGPFELIDQLGARWVAEHLAELDVKVPALLAQVGDGTFYKSEGTVPLQFSPGGYKPIVRPPGVLLLEDVKRNAKPVLGGKVASAWDLGDGVLCFEVHSEVRGALLNMLDADVLGLLEKTLALVGKSYKALVLYNDDLRQPAHKSNFSVGANIGMALLWSNIRLWGKIENSVKDGQRLYQAMRYAPFPIIGAVAGRALGGGCEMLLHCAAVQAHAESYIGLVETGVGVVPGWGGCATVLTRWQTDRQAPKGPMPAVAKVFEIISTATVSRSAAEAIELKFLKPTDGISMNRDRLLADAKARALELAEDYTPPQPRQRGAGDGAGAQELHGADPYQREPGADQKHR